MAPPHVALESLPALTWFCWFSECTPMAAAAECLPCQQARKRHPLGRPLRSAVLSSRSE